jgi:hypothetical protein
MKKIHIVITPNALKELVTNIWDYPMALVRLQQHVIVFSNTIIDEYERAFAEDDCLFEFQEWYKNFTTYDYSQEVESASDNFYSDVTTLLEQYDHSIIVGHNESLGYDICSVLELHDINDNDNDNELSRQCIPATFTLPRGSSKIEFCKWLSELLCDEKNITIIDRYIMSDDASGVLEDIYIPTFPESANIYVYFGGREKSSIEVSYLKNTYGKRIRLFECISNDFHDRHIIGDSIRITINVGLDVFSCDGCGSRKESEVTVSSRLNVEFPRRVSQYAYAYR